MHLKRLSGKQKVYLLILGLAILLGLALFGKLFQNNRKIQEKPLIANEELLILGTKDSVKGLEKNQIYTDKGLYYCNFLKHFFS